MEILYGRNPILESLRARRRHPKQLLLSEGLQDRSVVGEILRLARSMEVDIRRVPREEVARLVGHDHHQGLALESSSYPYAQVAAMLETAALNGQSPFLLVLDLLQDPQNVGTLLRTAEAVGVHGVILQRRRAVGITPAVVNASSGAVEHLAVAQETNLTRALQGLKEAGVWIYGLEGRPELPSYHETTLGGPIALVVGSEGTGLRRLVRESCDVLVRLPMRGRVESLNAAVAGSIALYAIARERGF